MCILYLCRLTKHKSMNIHTSYASIPSCIICIFFGRMKNCMLKNVVLVSDGREKGEKVGLRQWMGFNLPGLEP